MKREKGFVKKKWIVLLIIFIILLPTGFKMALRHPTLSDFFSYEEQVKDDIDIYISILSTIVTLFLGYVAYRQNKVANVQNERLMRLEEISKKAYIKLDTKESKFTRTKNEYDCYIWGDNISDVPIIKIEYESAGKIIDNSKLKIETKKQEAPCEAIIEGNRIRLHFVDSFIQEETFIFCFKLILTGIYGYKTVQIFNIIVSKGMICEAYMREEAGNVIKTVLREH